MLKSAVAQNSAAAPMALIFEKLSSIPKIHTAFCTAAKAIGEITDLVYE
jgi:hypothetical protein